jgi:NADPH:quinone reductase-like Zn-dependent oxidoreductase
MKEAVVSAGPKVTIRDSEIPKPEPRQVVIKTIFAGCNPKVRAVLYKCLR